MVATVGPSARRLFYVARDMAGHDAAASLVVALVAAILFA